MKEEETVLKDFSLQVKGTNKSRLWDCLVVEKTPLLIY
jgi:hypothetical protein